MVPRHPAPRLRKTTSNIIHRIRRSKRQFPAGRLDQTGALLRGDRLVVHLDAAAGDGVGHGRLARVEVVPGVVGDVVGAAGLVDAEEVDGAPAVGDLDADVVAVYAHRPVGYAVGVDVTA